MGEHGRVQPATDRQGQDLSGNGMAGQSFRLYCYQYVDRSHAWGGGQARTVHDGGRVLLLDLVFCATRSLLGIMVLDWLALSISLVGGCVCGAHRDFFYSCAGTEPGSAGTGANCLRVRAGVDLLFIFVLLHGPEPGQRGTGRDSRSRDRTGQFRWSGGRSRDVAFSAAMFQWQCLGCERPAVVRVGSISRSLAEAKRCEPEIGVRTSQVCNTAFP